MSRLLSRRNVLMGGTALLLASTAGRAASAKQTALAFARALYAFDDYWSGVTSNEATTRLYLDKPLADLVIENQGKESFESALSYDPLIQAQDWDEDLTATFTVNAENDKTASVTVKVDNYGERTFVILELVNTSDGWRLGDVIASCGASLVEELKQLNALS